MVVQVRLPRPLQQVGQRRAGLVLAPKGVQGADAGLGQGRALVYRGLGRVDGVIAGPREYRCGQIQRLGGPSRREQGNQRPGEGQRIAAFLRPSSEPDHGIVDPAQRQQRAGQGLRAPRPVGIAVKGTLRVCEGGSRLLPIEEEPRQGVVGEADEGVARGFASLDAGEQVGCGTAPFQLGPRRTPQPQGVGVGRAPSQDLVGEVDEEGVVAAAVGLADQLGSVAEVLVVDVAHQAAEGAASLGGAAQAVQGADAVLVPRQDAAAARPHGLEGVARRVRGRRRGAGHAVGDAIGQVQHGGVLIRVVEREQQGGEVQLVARQAPVEAGADRIAALLGAAQREQRLGLEFVASSPCGPHLLGRPGVLQSAFGVVRGEVRLGEGVADVHGELPPGALPRRLEIGVGLLEPAELDRGRTAGPQQASLWGVPVCQRVRCVVDGGPACAGQPLAQQLRALVQIRARQGREHVRQHRVGVGRSAELVQGDQATADQGEQWRAPGPQRQGVPVHRAPQGRARQPRRARSGPLRRAVEEAVRQVQGRVESAGLGEQVELVGRVQAALTRCRHRVPDPRLALLLPAQGEQGLGLELGGAGLVRRHDQGGLGLLQGELRLAPRQVQVGEGVPGEVLEAAGLLPGSLQRGEEILDGALVVRRLGAARAAQPQAGGVIVGALQRGVGQRQDRRVLRLPVGLADQLGHGRQVVVVRGSDQRLEHLPGVFGPARVIQGAQPVLGQHDQARQSVICGRCAALVGFAQGRGREAPQRLVATAAQSLDRREQLRGDGQGRLGPPRVVELEQQVHEVELVPLADGLQGRPDGGLPLVAAIQGEQGLRPQIEALGAVRIPFQRAVRVLERRSRVPGQQGHLGQGVLELGVEAPAVGSGGAQALVEVLAGALGLAELGPPQPAQPQGVGEPLRAVEDGGGQLDHGLPLGVAARLVQQLGRGGEVVAGRGLEHGREDGARAAAFPQPVQGGHAAARQRERRGPHVALGFPGPAGARVASGDGSEQRCQGRVRRLPEAVEDDLGEVQRGGVSSGVHQQVEQERLPQDLVVLGGLQALADPGLPIVGQPETHEGAGLELCALGLVGPQRQGQVGLLHGLLELAPLQVDLGEGVVDGVLEVNPRPLRERRAGLQIGQGAVEIVELGAGRSAYPQGVGELVVPRQRAAGHLHHQKVVAVGVGLEQQLGDLGQLVLVGGLDGRGQDGLPLLGTTEAVQRAHPRPHQRDEGLAALAQRDVLGPVRRSGQQHLGHAPHGCQGRAAGARRQLEQHVGVSQGCVEALGLAQGIQQVGQVEPHRRIHTLDARLQHRAALVHAPQGEQRARLHLEAGQLIR